MSQVAQDSLTVLQRYFGYDSFRGGQQDLICDILAGKDVLGIMPTGAGKSICFQVPALMFSGITLVVSPLISLMTDQVGALIQAGVRAAYINSSLTSRQVYLALRNAKIGKYKIIYVAPERLFSPDFIDFAQSVNISMVTVDEAHCVSQWGQDFRPSYGEIPRFLSLLPQRPVLSAFTATATQRVRTDILSQLGLVNPAVLVTGFDRQNLYFEVQQPKQKLPALVDFLEPRRALSGVVYCNTRKNVEEVCQNLQERGFSAARYHAGLEDVERRQNQEDFLYDRVQIMVATNAFGMGIDKSNVSFVVHYNMPKDVESYYQEAGRAGRDGSPADCLLLYSGQDVRTNRWMIENGKDNLDVEEGLRQQLQERELTRLRDMTFYATTQDCLRRYLLRYFGEKPPRNCDHCGNCVAPQHRLDSGKKDEPRERRDRNNTKPSATVAELSPEEQSLFRNLRTLRQQVAVTSGVPAFVVFSDSTLADMSRRRPDSYQAFLQVSGVGETKAKRYGKTFLEEIAKHKESL